jgi:hypothetical protein
MKLEFYSPLENQGRVIMSKFFTPGNNDNNNDGHVDVHSGVNLLSFEKG